MTDDEMYELAAQVDYCDAQRYVLARGWIKSPYSSETIGSFHLKDHDVRLPMDRTFLDYGPAMVRFATLVGRAEGRKPEHVLLDLTAKDADRHRWTSAGAKDTSLEGMMRFLGGAQQALYAAACAVTAESGREGAQRFASAARFRNTEADSFEVVIDTPLEVNHASESFGRAASVMLMRSAAYLAQVLQQGDPDRILNPPPGSPVVSAALCEALLTMALSEAPFDLRLAVSWSPSREAPQDVPQQVVLSHSMWEPLRLVAELLRSKAPAATGRSC